VREAMRNIAPSSISNAAFSMNANPSTPLFQPTVEHFEARVGERLEVSNDDQIEQWVIERVERRSPHALRADPPFNLYLTAPAAPTNRTQGVRRARLASGEAFEFFAVPIAASASSISFEVIFN
jgi:hypothetical protein